MEITKIVIIVILALLVVIEALIIWALSERNDGRIAVYNQRETTIKVLSTALEEQRIEIRGWKNAYIKEKRQSDHKSRKIESMYRGEMIKKLKEVAVNPG